MQLPSGVLADSIGPRRLFTGGSLVAGVGSLVFAFAPDVGWILDYSAAEAALVGYQRAAALLALVAAIGVVAAFQLRETRCRRVYQEREPC